MRHLFNITVLSIVSLIVCSCTTATFEKLLADGKYKDAENIVKKMKGVEKYDCAELLIHEYLELEEYDKAVYVYEKITPEHCSNSNMKFSNLYCHGAGENYELNVTSLFRKAFMKIGDYDKVWQYSVWDSDSDNGYNAEAYYKFMSEVVLYLCSTGNKAEANKFVNHYVFWFDTRIDNNSYYSTDKPEFSCNSVRSKLQRIINTY